MKKWSKFLAYIVTFVLFIGVNIPPNVFATTSFNITDKVNVDVNKIWTIKFNNELDKSTIDGKDNVLVLDDKGAKVNIKVEYEDSKTLLISPINNYEYGKTYTLVVKDTVAAKNGKGMKKTIEMRFTTKTNTTQIKTIEDMSVILYKCEKYTLPSVVKAVMIDNTEKSVSVKWDNTYIDTSKPGTYYYKGTVLGYDKQVNLKIVVSSSTGVDLSRVTKVCIDPFSASNLQVLTGPTGIQDKDVNLSIALKLGKLLENKDIKVTYTRQSDSVSWNESEDVLKRDKIANDSESEVLISIRANYYSSSTAEGIETYYLGADSKSNTLAQQVQKNVISKTNAKDRGAKEVGENHIKFLQGFHGVGILVYGGFISNTNEEKLLNSSQYQDKIAQGIADSIINNSSSNTITSVKDINANVIQGNSYVLPTKVTAIDDKNNSVQADVIWEENNVDTSKVGTYVVKGRVKGYSKLITLTVVVSPKPSAKYKICIDPGHGGYDSGAVGPGGTKEKDVVLQVSLKLGQILAKNGVDVVYTRTSDNVPWPANKSAELKMRCDISDKAKVNYFVSIHANSVDGSPSTSGIETLYGDNRTDGIPLATNIQNEMVATMGGKDRGLKKRSIYVVKWTAAPSALVELEFISNPQKEKLLKSPEYQQKCAEAIARGIMKTLH